MPIRWTLWHQTLLSHCKLFDAWILKTPSVNVTRCENLEVKLIRSDGENWCGEEVVLDRLEVEVNMKLNRVPRSSLIESNWCNPMNCSIQWCCPRGFRIREIYILTQSKALRPGNRWVEEKHYPRHKSSRSCPRDTNAQIPRSLDQFPRWLRCHQPCPGTGKLCSIDSLPIERAETCWPIAWAGWCRGWGQWRWQTEIGPECLHWWPRAWPRGQWRWQLWSGGACSCCHVEFRCGCASHRDLGRRLERSAAVQSGGQWIPIC